MSGSLYHATDAVKTRWWNRWVVPRYWRRWKSATSLAALALGASYILQSLQVAKSFGWWLLILVIGAVCATVSISLPFNESRRLTLELQRAEQRVQEAERSSRKRINTLFSQVIHSLVGTMASPKDGQGRQNAFPEVVVSRLRDYYSPLNIRCSYFEYQATSHRLVKVCSNGYSPIQNVAFTADTRKGQALLEAIRHSEPLVVANTDNGLWKYTEPEPGDVFASQKIWMRPYKSFIVVPVSIAGRSYGFLEIASPIVGVLTDTDKNFLCILAELLAIGLVD